MAQRKAGSRGISDEAVQKRTGKSWVEWYAILDRWGMNGNGHTLAARHLQQEHGLSPWWAQVVTIRYEWERGLRTEAQEGGG